MIDLNAIKIDKLFNIQKNKNETEKRNSKLVYYIRQYSCFPEHAEYVYQPEMLRTEKLKLFLDSMSKEEKLCSDLKRLSIYQIEIMNIGNGALQGTDFFNNSKLRIENCNFYVGFIDNTFTKPYINARIEKYEDSAYYIDFDYLKPNDSIYISFISDKQTCASYTIVKGETKEFESPISCYENSALIKRNQIKFFFVNMFIFLVLVFFIGIAVYYINSYLSELAEKSPVLKINFSVVNVKK